MMQVIQCFGCGVQSIPLDNVHVNLKFTKSAVCQSCHSSKDEASSYYFCSEKCFYNFMEKVNDGVLFAPGL